MRYQNTNQEIKIDDICIIDPDSITSGHWKSVGGKEVKVIEIRKDINNPRGRVVVEIIGNETWPIIIDPRCLIVK